METVNKLLEKVCLVTKISFKYFIFKKFCTDKKLELLFLLGHILQPREKIKRHPSRSWGPTAHDLLGCSDL
jgi:hypothetical protein